MDRRICAEPTKRGREGRDGYSPRQNKKISLLRSPGLCILLSAGCLRVLRSGSSPRAHTPGAPKLLSRASAKRPLQRVAAKRPGRHINTPHSAGNIFVPPNFPGKPARRTGGHTRAKRIFAPGLAQKNFCPYAGPQSLTALADSPALGPQLDCSPPVFRLVVGALFVLELHLRRDGSVTTSDLLAGAHALEQLRGLNRFMKLVIGMLSVVVLILLVGSFGSTMAAINLSKETTVSGHVLVTPGGDAVRVMSNEYAVDESGRMVTRDPLDRSGKGAAVATVPSAEHVTSLHLVNGTGLMGVMMLDRAEVCRVRDRMAQGVVDPVVADWDGGAAHLFHATIGVAEASGPCESSAVTMMGQAGLWEWRVECEASTGANSHACLVHYLLSASLDGSEEEGDSEEGGRRTDDRGAARRLQLAGKSRFGGRHFGDICPLTGMVYNKICGCWPCNTYRSDVISPCGISINC
jgi:hypothetical protein